jgi:hypothetical protein
MTELDALTLEMGLEEATEEILNQYFSSITEYILAISSTLQSADASEFISSLDEETKRIILNETSKIVDLCVEWELWELYDEGILILRSLS